MRQLGRTLLVWLTIASMAAAGEANLAADGLAHRLTVANSPTGTLETPLANESQDAPEAQSGQTLVFMMTVMGIDLVAQTAGKFKSGEPLSEESLLQHSGEAAQQILQNTSWLSLITAYGAGEATRAPSELLAGMITNPATHKLLFEGLRLSIFWGVTLYGLDLGQQLMSEAAFRLPDSAERDRANSLWGVTKGSLSALVNSNPQNQADLKIMSHLIDSVFQVALLNSKWRHEFLSNTWRTYFKTGESVALLSGFVAAGVAGARAGRWWGVMFAVAGWGVAEFLIPERAKDKMTSFMQNSDLVTAENSLLKNEQEIDRKITWGTIWGAIPFLPKATIEALINRRRQLRSDYVTAAMTQAWLEAKRDKSADQTFLARKFSETNHFLVSEQKHLQRLLTYATSSRQTGMADILALEIKRVEFVAGFLQQVGDSLKADSPDLTRQTMLSYLESIFNRAFNEDQVMEMASQN